MKTKIHHYSFNISNPDERAAYEAMKKKTLSDLISRSLEELGREETVALADRVKDLGFYYVTTSGISIGSADIRVPVERVKLLEEANESMEGNYISPIPRTGLGRGQWPPYWLPFDDATGF